MKKIIKHYPMTDRLIYVCKMLISIFFHSVFILYLKIWLNRFYIQNAPFCVLLKQKCSDPPLPLLVSRGLACMVLLSTVKSKLVTPLPLALALGTRQLGPRTTRSEDKSARKRGLVDPYVKATRTVWKDYSDHQ